ncbi:MAG: permease-like cell division protein FtsX [Oscillospiraceae bacterium]|nr:permease-like cell division protein FtsX [Oscillospiraceae bacterium]
MRGSSFGYLVKEGSRNIWTNRMMSIASVGVLVACMLLIGTAVLFSINLNQVMGYMEDQNEMVAFIDDDASAAAIKKIDAALGEISNIGSMTYVSREQAIEEYKKIMGDSGTLLDGLEEDEVFPNSYRIQVDDLSRLEETVEDVESITGIMKVNAPTDVAQTITSVKQIVYVAGTGIVGILVAVSLLIIANTIKITVFNRRREINIMKYVGATDTFIRLPFLVEGTLLGLISAVIAYLALWGGYTYVLNWLEENQSIALVSFTQNFLPFSSVTKDLLLGFVLGGVGIGGFGSMIFVRRYLKV